MPDMEITYLFTFLGRPLFSFLFILFSRHSFTHRPSQKGRTAMPRRKSVRKAAATAAAAAPPNNTPAWLHRLHAKAGIFFPTHLHIDDFLYGRRQQPFPHQPLPPLRASPSHHTNPIVLLESPTKVANPKQHQQPSDAPPHEIFRREYNLRPRAKPIHTPSSHPCEGNEISEAKKRRRSKGDGDSDGEYSNMTDVTVIDTSTDGWKAAKVLIHRGDTWKVCEKEPLGVTEQDDALEKGKRRGLVSRMLRDKEMKQERDATSSIERWRNSTALGHTTYVSPIERHYGVLCIYKGKDAVCKHITVDFTGQDAFCRPCQNSSLLSQGTMQSGKIHAGTGDVVEKTDDPIHALKSPRCAGTESEGSAAITPELTYSV
ncbi:hypothetical protein ACP4OV_012753 [Aristida adscensionis]